MFIRLFKKVKEKTEGEFLVNLDHISLIEVKYILPTQGPLGYLATVEEGLSNPDANRWYTISVAGETFHVPFRSQCPVSAALEKIYRESLKS